MDIFTHLLTGLCISNVIYKRQHKFKSAVVCFGTLIPDIGEIIIQRSLNQKYNESYGVYDSRTSDFEIASNLNVTFVYDTLHSFILPLFILTISCFFVRQNILLRKYLSMFAFGLISHVLLDCFTHGKIWALKLFFPISNIRIPILVETVGNWWDWTPKLKILYFQLPVLCFFIWTVLIALIIFAKFKRT
jgi:LexA-binding, inner membrane-associated putative hydrolase